MSDGSFGAIYCNKNQLPPDPYAVDSSIYYGCDYTNGSNLPSDIPTTDTFISTSSLVFDTYDDFLATNIFNVHDGSAYWQLEEGSSSEGESSKIFSINGDRAIAETQPVKTFNLIFSE